MEADVHVGRRREHVLHGRDREHVGDLRHDLAVMKD
jgi:hypothetical protein